jgi:hypothetical protein
LRGFFLQQNIKLYDKVFITLAGRIDGSSVFAKNNRNNFYPKASISYSLSDSKYFQKLTETNIVNSIKLRLAYGESGNLTGIGPYERFNSYSASAYLGRSALNSSPTQASLDLKPERQKEIELGTDISLLDNRIGLTLNVYSKKVVDLLVPNVTVAPSVGFTNERKNVGTLTNKGIEILVNATPVRYNDIEWNVTGIYNRNINKIGTLGGPSLITFSMGNGSWFALIPGQSAPVFYLTSYAKDANGNLLLNPFDGNNKPLPAGQGIPVIDRGNAAGVPQRDQATGLPYTSGANSTILRKNLGSPNPKYTASLVNSISYKKFVLSFQLDRVSGNSVFNADFRTRQGVGNGSELAQKEQNGELPRGYIQRTYTIEEWRLEDGSFTKLRELSLSYNLGSIKKIFTDVTVTVTGRNLKSWDNYRGYDPETNATGQNTLLRGVDFGNVPIPRSFMLSIATKF